MKYYRWGVYNQWSVPRYEANQTLFDDNGQWHIYLKFNNDIVIDYDFNDYFGDFNSFMNLSTLKNIIKVNPVMEDVKLAIKELLYSNNFHILSDKEINFL